MTTFLWVLIVLALAVGVAVVAWTQHTIWRRLDRMDQDITDTDERHDIGIENDQRIEQRLNRLRAQTIAALSARTDLTQGGIHPSEHFRKDPS